MLRALIGKNDWLGESLQTLGSNASTDRSSADRDPRILFLVAGSASFVGSRYLTCKNDKRGGGQRKSVDLKMLINEITVNWSGGSVKGKGYTGRSFP